jgi:transcription elongation GreA/GreB family factor
MFGTMPSNEELLEFKSEVYRTVIKQFDSIILQLRKAIDELQLAVNEETKSSVGDKYETGRSMIMLEIEKLSHQLRDRIDAKNFISAVKVRRSTNVELGSFVRTDSGNFYLLQSIGNVVINGETVVTISMQSPLGKLFIGKSAGSDVALNGKTMHIKEVF